METLSVKTLLVLVLLAGSFVSEAAAQVVEITNGRIEGITKPNGVRVFKGLPYAKPPVDDLRWKPPQLVEDWTGIRPADRFGPQCMQQRVFGDMIFRSAGMSEDCLYLNVWTPAASSSERLPVLVYIYGGGFIAGDGSEPRYDGESMARKGMVVVTLNYRLGIFGFFAHPALTEESPHGASGNYGLLDQAQALHWVHENIEAFGGDPARITIAGESAGSMSVSAVVVSPLAKGLIEGAIGESGSILGTFPPVPLAEAERNGVQFAHEIGVSSLAELRAISSTRLLDLASMPDLPRFALTIDGYFFPEPPAQVYAAGEQAHVPLLVGWNSEEMNYRALLQQKTPTPENYADVVRELYGDRAEDVLKLYGATTREEVIQVATDLASDRFIGFSTWKWSERHRSTGAPVYRYFYTHPRPPMKSGSRNSAPAAAAPLPHGAVHSAEIEYALGNLSTNDVYAWTPADYKVSEIMQGYFANFVKTGTPNGAGLPNWPAAGTGDRAMVMWLDVEPHAEPAKHRERYLFLDQALDE